MQYIKAFISGAIFPGIFMPIALLIATLKGNTELTNLTSLHLIPIIWGIWNILYFAFFKNSLKASLNIRLLITGGILGLILASYAVFWLDLPTILGIPTQVHCLPLLVAPILYALIWRYVVKYLNDMVGLKDEE